MNAHAHSHVPASPAAASPGATHEHVFLGSDHRRNERRVWLVIALTAAMMVVEIAAGTVFGSMALVADGWHMSTHAGAMLITALAYFYARRHVHDTRFSFGTGKLGDLAGFASALVLALIALLIGWESFLRLVDPVPILFGQAIVVAVLGLIVNLVSAWLLKDDHAHHRHGHDSAPAHHRVDAQGQSSGFGHGHDHEPGNEHRRELEHGRGHEHRHSQESGRGHEDDRGHVRDNNLRAAYVHVLADALTSVLAIVALLLGRSYGWLWADPVMGVVGALVIARWSWGLIREAGSVLLDASAESEEVGAEIREALAATGDTITDLHVWQVGPGHFAAIVSLASVAPGDSSQYKTLLSHIHELSHLTLETQRLPLETQRLPSAMPTAV